MSLEADLLAAILARPDDEGPRLVHADRLVERGDPRGELIVLQCALARGGLSGAEERQLRERERALLAEHAEAWIAGLGLSTREHRSSTWVGGFLEHLYLGVAELDQVWERVVMATPLRAVTLVNLQPEQVEHVVRRPWPAHVTRLALIRTRLSPRAVELVASAPSLRHVVALDLGGAGLGGAGVRALAASLELPALRRLGLAENELTSNDLGPLLASPGLAGLEVLRLDANPLGGVGSVLAGSPGLRGLVRLEISRAGLGPGDAIDLAAAPWSRLAHLDLSRNPLGDGGLAALAASPGLPALTELDVPGIELGADGLAAFVGSPLVRLARLNLGWSGLERAADTLARADVLPALRELRMIGTKAGAAAQAIATRPLTRLELPSTRLTREEVGALAGMAGLRSLDLSHGGIADQGIAHLAASPALGKLRLLNLYGNGVTSVGAQALASSAHLGELVYLDLGNNRVKPNGERALVRRFGPGIEQNRSYDRRPL